MIVKLLIYFTLLVSFAQSGLLDFYTIYQAKKSYERGDYNKSLKLFKKLKMDNPVFNYNLANSYYKTKNYKMAILYYKRSFGEGVQESNRLHNLGNAYLELKDYKSAIIAYESALKLKDNNDTKANLELAKLLKKKKNRDKQKHKKQKEKKKNVKHSKKKNKKQLARKKLSKEELKKLKELERKQKLNRELKKFIKKSLEGKKLPVLMYRIKEGNVNYSPKNPW